MPALNEEANIAGAIKRTLEAFDRYGLSGEIIVINDGSTDGTPRIVEEKSTADRRIKMIRHPVPLGVGASFRDGVLEARGEAVAFMPGDDENEPGEIMRYCDLLRKVDMVVPFVYNRGVRSLFRNTLSTAYRNIINFTFGVNFNYTNGTVLYRSSVLKGCENRSNGFFFQTENVIRAARRGYLFAEVPYRLDAREGGESKAVSLRSLKQVIKDFLCLVAEIYFSKSGLKRELAPDSVAARNR